MQLIGLDLVIWVLVQKTNLTRILKVEVRKCLSICLSGNILSLKL